MDVGKIIRILGYIAYTTLWLPIILLAVVAAPIVLLATDIRMGRPIRGSIKALKSMLMDNIRHDMEFIRTGRW